MNFKAKMQKGAALQPLPPPMRHMCARRGQLGTAKRGNIFHIYFPAMHTHTFTCIFIYKHARAFAVSKQRHERERGSVCVWGKAPQVKCSMQKGQEKQQKNVARISREQNHVAAAVDVDCEMLRQDAKFNFTCGK